MKLPPNHTNACKILQLRGAINILVIFSTNHFKNLATPLKLKRFLPAAFMDFR